jgi:hypothetical protein
MTQKKKKVLRYVKFILQHSRRLFGQPRRLLGHDTMQSGLCVCVCVCANILEEHDVFIFRIELKMEELCSKEIFGPTFHSVSEDHNMTTDMNISNLYIVIFI